MEQKYNYTQPECYRLFYAQTTVEPLGETEWFVMSVQRKVINIRNDEKVNHKTEYTRLRFRVWKIENEITEFSTGGHLQTNYSRLY